MWCLHSTLITYFSEYLVPAFLHPVHLSDMLLPIFLFWRNRFNSDKGRKHTHSSSDSVFQQYRACGWRVWCKPLYHMKWVNEFCNFWIYIYQLTSIIVQVQKIFTVALQLLLFIILISLFWHIEPCLFYT
jgi:hypothetical protein